jgi:hypothetical protein
MERFLQIYPTQTYMQKKIEGNKITGKKRSGI